METEKSWEQVSNHFHKKWRLRRWRHLKQLHGVQYEKQLVGFPVTCLSAAVPPHPNPNSPDNTKLANICKYWPGETWLANSHESYEMARGLTKDVLQSRCAVAQISWFNKIEKGRRLCCRSVLLQLYVSVCVRGLIQKSVSLQSEKSREWDSPLFLRG